MNYVESFNLLGVEAKQLPCIKGEGAPTTATEGAVGCLYMDTLTGDTYKCTAASDGVYTWIRVLDENDKNEITEVMAGKFDATNVAQTTGGAEDKVMSQKATTKSLEGFCEAIESGNVYKNISFSIGSLSSSTGIEVNNTKHAITDYIKGNCHVAPEGTLASFECYAYKYSLDKATYYGREMINPMLFLEDGYLYRIFFKYSDNRELISDDIAVINENIVILYNTYAYHKKDESLTVADCCNSWWCNPRTHYNELRDTAWVGGITSQGLVGISVFDLRNNKSDFIRLGYCEKDDHDVPAFLIEDDKPPIVAYTGHASTNYVRFRKGLAPYDVKSLETAEEKQISFVKTDETTTERCTYSSLLRKPNTNTIALITRRGSALWVRVSNDYGETWQEPYQFTKWLYYGTFTKNGNSVKYVLTTHPTESGNARICTFTISLETGNVIGADGTTIANIWDYENFTSPIALSKTDTVIEDGNLGFRVFDIASNGNILAMKLLKYQRDESNNFLTDTEGNYIIDTDGTGNGAYKPELGGIYGYFTKINGVWSFIEYKHSGVPVGYYVSSYVGGCCFDRSAGGNVIYVTREENGQWIAERALYNNSAKAWRVINRLQEGNTFKIGRPQFLTSGKITCCNYYHYATDTYADYYGDQKILCH